MEARLLRDEKPKLKTKSGGEKKKKTRKYAVKERFKSSAQREFDVGVS